MERNRDFVMNYEDFSLFLPPPLEAVLEGIEGFPGGSVVKNLSTKAGNLGLIPGLGKIPRRRAWQPTQEFLPRKFHGQRSLGGYSPWGYKEWDKTE